MARPDPLRNSRFRLEIDGIEQAGFAAVALGPLTADVIEYREGDEITTVRKLNGLNRYGNITLKWGITSSTELADWHQLVVDDATPLDDARRNVVIRVQDEAGNDTAAFEVAKAWPCRYDPTDLNALGTDVAIDELELCNEGIRRIQ
ncbi:MAG: phage tail protein [Acidimicrobiia bacterium]|nr:phage tail protein [Acidimicrobiia bacterium]